jgi:hypothetical protein
MSTRRWLVGTAVIFLGLLLSPAACALAHDSWLQATPSLVRPGDVVHVDLLLGNHGNDHRDFKVAGKLGSLEGVTLAVLAPTGRSTDLVPDLVDLGSAPREGFWSGRFIAAEEGLHCAALTRDGIRHGARGLKSAKTYFLVAERLDAPPRTPAAVPGPLGHPLELVLESHPLIGCGPGREIAVRLLHHGRPAADERVTFIPRGTTLAEGFDPEFERRTDAEGRCRYTPKEGNLLLVVAHRTAPEEKSADYDRTSYAATLLVNVPQRCAGCAE